MTIRDLWDDGDPHAPAGFTAWGESVTDHVDDGWIPYRSGFWIVPVGTITTGSPAIGAIWARPVPVVGGRGVTIDQMGMSVTTAQADTEVRLGVYRLTPRATDFAELVVDGGTVDSTSTGDKVLTLGSTVHLVQGAYVFVAVAQGAGAAPTVRINGNNPAAGPIPIWYTTFANSGGSGSYRSWIWTGITGALPATLANPGHILTGATIVGARVA